MAITVNTGGPQQKQLLTPPPVVHTGGPGQVQPAPTPNTGGPNPPVPAPGGLPASSPIQVEDWASKLAAGNTNAQTQQVQGDQLVSNQLNGLMREDSQYLRQARDHAMNAASGNGMLMSTMAAGASQRAAIDAAMPIAQADAARYGSVADQNMAATNTDRLADQSMYGQLLGQEVGINANLAESERARGFTARENDLQRKFQTGERVGAQQFQQSMQSMQNVWQAAQNNAQLKQQLTLQQMQEAHDAAQRALDRSFTGTQNDKQLAQQRFSEFETAMKNQSEMLSNTLSAIYSNPNLNASQQAQAAANARAMYQSLFNSYAHAMSGGVPQIFWNPYPMAAGQSMPSPNINPPLPPAGGTGGGGGGGGTGITRNPSGGLFGSQFVHNIHS